LVSYINRLQYNVTLKNPFSQGLYPNIISHNKGHAMSKNIIGNLMKQAQQMQERVKKLQEEAAGKTVEASSGGGMVTVVANGRQEVLSIKIDPSVVDPKDIDMLQDLVTAAVNEALRKSQDLMKDEMAKLTAGMGLPPGLI
jgi:DNA-binding YbaB/EbfC family protein